MVQICSLGPQQCDVANDDKTKVDWTNGDDDEARQLRMGNQKGSAVEPQTHLDDAGFVLGDVVAEE
jgi:hypothetical protein